MRINSEVFPFSCLAEYFYVIAALKYLCRCN